MRPSIAASRRQTRQSRLSLRPLPADTCNASRLRQHGMQPRSEAKSPLNPHEQYAALPYVILPDGKIEVCLVTSRETKRWVIPKGWPKSKLEPHMLARREAREEAGLVGEISTKPIGTYTYRKKLHIFAYVTCVVSVYPLRVETHRLNWPERGERELSWCAPEDAALRVAEPELAGLIANLPAWLSARAAA